MPHIDEISASKYLSKTDLKAPLLLTVSHCTEENLAMEGQAAKMKWVVHFKEENVKPMVLNPINAQLIAQFTGQVNTDDWTGHKIVAYNDPTIAFQGKLTGGIRCRAPKFKKPANPAPAPAPVPEAAHPAPAEEFEEAEPEGENPY